MKNKLWIYESESKLELLHLIIVFIIISRRQCGKPILQTLSKTVHYDKTIISFTKDTTGFTLKNNSSHQCLQGKIKCHEYLISSVSLLIAANLVNRISWPLGNERSNADNHLIFFVSQRYIDRRNKCLASLPLVAVSRRCKEPVLMPGILFSPIRKQIGVNRIDIFVISLRCEITCENAPPTFTFVQSDKRICNG